jgi:hypothetical protein
MEHTCTLWCPSREAVIRGAPSAIDLPNVLAIRRRPARRRDVLQEARVTGTGSVAAGPCPDQFPSVTVTVREALVVVVKPSMLPLTTVVPAPMGWKATPPLPKLIGEFD